MRHDAEVAIALERYSRAMGVGVESSMRATRRRIAAAKVALNQRGNMLTHDLNRLKQLEQQLTSGSG
jgi:hypothetical protein